MYAHVVSLGVTGLDGYPVTVETHISGGLPKFAMVGLPDSAVKESSERVRSAIKNLNCPWPASHVAVNLAPADVRKTGPVYDLPLLLALVHWIAPSVRALSHSSLKLQPTARAAPGIFG